MATEIRFAAGDEDMSDAELRAWIVAQRRREASRAARWRVARLAALPVLAALYLALAVPTALAGGFDPLLRSHVITILKGLDLLDDDGTLPPAAGWTDGGTDVELTTATDGVGIGGDGPSSSQILAVVGDGTRHSIALTPGAAGEAVLAGDSVGGARVGGGALAASEILDVTGNGTRHTVAVTPGTGGTFRVNGSSVATVNVTAEGDQGGAIFRAGAVGNKLGAHVLGGSKVFGGYGSGFSGTADGSWEAGEAALADSVATAVVSVSCPTETGVGGTIRVTVYATDGTDMQTITKVATFCCVNKAGTETVDLDEMATTSNAVSAGSITLTLTAAAGTNAITISADANPSLASTTVLRASYVLEVYDLE